MNPKSYRRSKNSTLMQNEMRSWSKNKMEDRKLALKQEQVDKHMLGRRKSHQYEKDMINKDFEQKISKTTPTMDEYLDRSYHRYNAWRERERERLNRRYRSLYKSYMSEYRKLSLGEYAPAHIHNSDDIPKVPNDTTDVLASPSLPIDSVNGGSGQHEEENEDEFGLLSLEQLRLDTNRRRFSTETASSHGPPPSVGVRRKSTGSIAPVDMFKLSMLTVLHEHREDSSHAADGTINKTEVEKTAVLGNTKDNAYIEREPFETIKLPKGFKPSRRASVAVASSIPVGFPPLGKRLDRRSSIANIAIPMNYGN